MYQRSRPQQMDAQDKSRCDEMVHCSSATQTRTSWEGIEMAKKKNISVGTIKGIDIVRQTKPMQDIPFRTGVYTDKRKKREKINKNRLDKWL